MARDVRRLEVIDEMRTRNRMFANSRNYVVVKSQEFYSKNPIFDEVTNGLPKTSVSSSEKKVEPKPAAEVIEQPAEDRTLKGLLVDLNKNDPEENRKEQPKQDESVEQESGSRGKAQVGNKRSRDEGDDTTSGGGPGGSGGREDGGAKLARSEEGDDVGGAKEEAQAEEAEEGGIGRGGQPDCKEEAQA